MSRKTRPVKVPAKVPHAGHGIERLLPPFEASGGVLRDMDAEGDGANWELVNEGGLLPRVAAAAIRERLEREGFTADQMEVLGAISEASIRNVARLRRKP